MNIRILAAAAAAFIAFAPAGAQPSNTAAANASVPANAAAANEAAPAGNAATAEVVPVPADTGNAAPAAVDTAYAPPPPPPRPHGFPWGILGLIGLIGLLPLFRRGGDS